MTPAELIKAISAAMPGDVLSIPAGSYGAFTFTRPGVSYIAAPGAVFDKITLMGEDWSWRGGRVEIPAVEATIVSTAGVRVVNAKRGKVEGVTIVGALAVSGVPETSDTLIKRPGNNIIGWPTGQGVSVEFSEAITLTGNDISRCFKAIVLARSPGCKVLDNHTHHLRSGHISGDAPNDTEIRGNHLEVSNPWKWGTPVGSPDHADFIHMWTPVMVPPLTEPSRNVVVSENFIDQGDGADILCILMEDNSKCGFVESEVSDNVFLSGNPQGVALSHFSGRVLRNRGCQTSGTVKQGPTLLERPGCTLTVQGNRLPDTYGIAAKYPENEWLAAGVRPPAEIDAARNTALKALGIIPPDPRDVALAEAVARIAALTAELSAANDNRDAAKAEAETLKLRLSAIYTMAAP